MIVRPVRLEGTRSFQARELRLFWVELKIQRNVFISNNEVEDVRDNKEIFLVLDENFLCDFISDDNRTLVDEKLDNILGTFSCFSVKNL
jgi:hypothetical protein